VTSPDIQRLDLRQELAEKVCGFKFVPAGQKLTYDDVKWTTILSLVPQAVTEFVETFSGVYHSIEEPFKIMDASGDGSLTMTEMQTFARRIGIGDDPPRTIREPEKWQRKQWLVEVYRYLDADGGGEIGLEEWMVLDEIFNAQQIAVKELLDFLELRFGSQDNAWKYISGLSTLKDLDGDKIVMETGNNWNRAPVVVTEFAEENRKRRQTALSLKGDELEITYPEFESMMLRLNFIGELKVLFSTIDTSGDGNIAESEWKDAVEAILGEGSIEYEDQDS
jgi:Ca2+-binding EF-hand superfamily protein